MTTLAQLPPIPRPPHDPTSWLLNGRIGWRGLELPSELQLTGEQSLALALAPDSQRSLTEARGSFGGLIPPGYTALGPDGSIYLLDTQHAQLKRFDPCECRFVPVPCFGGVGSGPRQLKDPHGIAVCAGNLFVCDTGNHRLSVFALHGFVLRGFWQPPPAAYRKPNPQLANRWEPFDLAFDQLGRVYVSDRANGCIHRFTPAGQWEKRLPGFGQVTWIATDCRNHLYVVVAGAPSSVLTIDDNGSSAEVRSSPAELSTMFPRCPFPVDVEGRLHLGRLCAAASPATGQTLEPRCPPGQAPERGVFDSQGNPVDCFVPKVNSYVTNATYLSASLDSDLYRCQWHRIILRGEIPAGARVFVATYTAEAELADEDIKNLGDVWETNQTATEMTKGQWDCLVRSGGGRFLWLKLEFRSNGKVTPRLDSIEIEFPRSVCAVIYRRCSAKNPLAPTSPIVS